MPETVTTPTRLGWNDARSLASRILASEGDWETVLTETHLSVSQEDIATAKKTLPDDGTNQVNELARTLLEWQDTQHPDVEIDQLPTSINGWNDARSVASAMKTLVQSDAGTMFGEIRTHVSTPLPTFTDARDMWEEVSTDDGNKALNEYARWLLNWEPRDSGRTESQQTTSETDSTEHSPYERFSPTSRVEACANDLLEVFETHQGGYGDIFSEYGNEFNLPSMGRATVVVMNAKGETHEERVQDIAHWLTEELDESKRAGNYTPPGRRDS